MDYVRWLVLYLGFACISNVNAQTSDQWQFTLTPILWNASVKASLSDSGGSGEPIFPDYSFFSLDNLTDYMSLKFEAKHGRYVLLFDNLRARYQDERSGRFANLNVSTKLGFIELAAAYQITDKYKLDLLAGVRRSFLDIDVSLSRLPDRTNSSDWTDPIIGARYNYSLTDNWQLWLRGDIGGFGVGTEEMVNAIADVQYRFNKYISATVGYRYLQIEFKEEDFLYDVSLKGVFLGLGIHF